MKKSISIAAVLSLAMLASSCTDKTAAAYAAELVAMLDSLSTKANKKLADEQKRYLEEALDFEENRDFDVLADLKLKRQSASTKLVMDQLIGGKTTASQVMNLLLPEYAEQDLTATQRIYEKRSDAHLDALKTLQDLSLDGAKLKALREAVAALSKRPELLATGLQYGQFGRDLKGNLDFHACVDANKSVVGLTAEVTSFQAKIKAIGSTNVTELARLNAALTVAEAGVRAATARRESTGRFIVVAPATVPQCTRP